MKNRARSFVKNMRICIAITTVFVFALCGKAFALQSVDSLKTERSLTIESESSTITEPKSESGIDTLVTYSAKDSARFDLKTKRMRLRGDAKLNYKSQKLNSEIIVMHFDESTLAASGAENADGRAYGFPKFNDQGEEYVGEKIRFNFKTNKGTINLGETELNEGFYFGTKIKRVSETEFFVKDGYYTTCDDPDPHYYFGSPKMKVKAKDRVFIDPIILYVEDLPVFILPFGLFFPSKGGRQSGVIIPSFFFSSSRGVVFEDFGVYLALSDYYDTQVTTNFYSKGGYMVRNKTRWKIKNVLDGNADIQYGKTRFNPDDEYTTNWSVRLYHNHTLNPYERYNVNLDLSTQNFFQNTSTNIQERMRQNVESRASYSKNFSGGSSLSLLFRRNQDIITDEYEQTFPNFTYSLPNMYPLKKLDFIPKKSWLRDISFKYNLSGSYQMSKKLQPDSSFKESNRSQISHRPSLSISPKLGYFTIKPIISFSADNYFRRLTRTYNSEDSTTSDKLEHGLYSEYWYSLGVNVSTRLFGIAKPDLLGISAFRHTLQPTIGFSFTPDLSDPSRGFYGTYYDEAAQREVVYSRFERDGGGRAPRKLASSLNYAFVNSFEIKVKQGDTIPDKNVELLRWNFNGSVNFAADSLQWSDIGMSFRTPSIGFLTFSSNAAFTLYDEDYYYDAAKDTVYQNRRVRVDEFLLSKGKGLMRLTQFSIQMGASFSSEGIQFGSSFGENKSEAPLEDSVSLGDRFSHRHSHIEKEKSMFGDDMPGYSPLKIPWSVNLGLNMSYGEPTVGNITRRISMNASFNMSLTQTWAIDATGYYDFVNMELGSPQINIRKDLHCWELSLRWTPIGYNRGFYLRFGIKSPQLRDLQIEKQSNPLLR